LRLSTDGIEVGVNVAVGGRGVKVNVASGVGLAGGINIVGVSVVAAKAVAGIPVSVIVTGCAGARLGPQAKSISRVTKRIEKRRIFIFIVNVSVLEKVVDLAVH
jgi:hypothetical protein